MERSRPDLRPARAVAPHRRPSAAPLPRRRRCSAFPPPHRAHDRRLRCGLRHSAAYRPNGRPSSSVRAVQLYFRDPAGNLVELNWHDAGTLDRSRYPTLRRLADQIRRRRSRSRRALPPRLTLDVDAASASTQRPAEPPARRARTSPMIDTAVSAGLSRRCRGRRAAQPLELLRRQARLEQPLPTLRLRTPAAERAHVEAPERNAVASAGMSNLSSWVSTTTAVSRSGRIARTQARATRPRSVGARHRSGVA